MTTVALEPEPCIPTCQFTVLGPPQPKERARRCPSGRHVTPKKTRAYEQLVGHLASLHKPPSWRLDLAYHVELRVYFGDARGRDIDNVLKSVLDGLNRALWHDDRQVVRVTAEKNVDRGRPRVEVCVQAVEAVQPTRTRPKQRLYARGRREERRQMVLGEAKE